MNAELTVRENEVAAHAAHGRNRKDIANRMGISVETVDCHLDRIRKKIGAETTLQVGLYFAKKLGVSWDGRKTQIVTK